MANSKARVGAAVALLFVIAGGFTAWLMAETAEPRVEIVGLDRWTRQMIEDSVQHHAPGTPLSSAACAVVLRESIGFAQAAVERWPPRIPVFGRDLVIITVVEPHDSARVRFGPEYTDSLPDRDRWSESITLLRSDYGMFQQLQDYEFVRGETDRPFGRDVSPETVRLRDQIRGYTSDADFEAALETLESDRNIFNRTVAALVLGNFGDRDTTWHTYLEALRRPTGHGTPAAEMMLRLLARNAARPVDWRPVAPTLRALLDGTNLFAYSEVVEALTATELSRGLGGDLLRNDGELLLAIIGTDGHPQRALVRRFLAHLAGEDFGNDATKWRGWIKAL